MSDAHFVAAIAPATQLVEAVHAGDVGAVRDVILAQRSEDATWALLVDLAAMVPAKPNPERVLRFACDVDTRLTYSERPGAWSMEDLQTALAVSRLRGDPEAGALWVRRGLAEWRRRRRDRDEHLAAADAAALAARAELRAVS